MRRLAFLLASLLAVISIHAQGITPHLTVYPSFRPATVYTAEGKKTRVPLANIFLKNSGLLYLNDKGTVLEVNPRTLLRVDFSDCTYFRIDSVLACPVDTVGSMVLYRARVIDVNAYRQAVKNSKNITSLDLSSMLSYTTIDLGEEEGFPLVPVYYISLDDRFVLAHERHLKRHLDREHRRRMEGLLSQPGFSWTDETSLVRLMEAIR